MNTKCIYVIAADELGPVKIGFSADPKRRLRQLQTGQATKLVLYHTEEFPATMIKVMEKQIHNENRYRRMAGEWFNMSVSDAIDEVKFAAIRWGDKETLLLSHYK